MSNILGFGSENNRSKKGKLLFVTLMWQIITWKKILKTIMQIDYQFPYKNEKWDRFLTN
jgi:hypothetical protein